MKLALCGLIAVVFGLFSFHATEHFGIFAGANLALGSLALAAAAIARARNIRGTSGPHARRLVVRGILRIAFAVVIAVALEQAAQLSGLTFDFTQEGTFELAPATLKACGELPDLRATLYFDPLDPRVRRTRLLLATLARQCSVDIQERVLDEEIFEVERHEVTSSNTVVLEANGRFETIGRPSEGAIYEGLYRLRSVMSGLLTVLRGDGEGDLESRRETGYTGLGTALETEGYRLRSVVSPALTVVPSGTDALLIVAPKRRLPDPALDAIRGYLKGGGSLVVLLEAFVSSGVEDVLAEYGLSVSEGVVVDPMFASPGGRLRGLDIIANSYETHPITRGLDRNRMTFFPGTRAFSLRKPESGDKLVRAVSASHRSWIAEGPSLLEGGAMAARPVPPDGTRRDYHPVVAAGRYERNGQQIRIVAFGDSQFASNRHLRTLFNLDLVLNAVHWSVAREPEITIRPKIRSTIQFPLPIASTLGTLYGVGLLVPELLLIAGSVVWLSLRHR